MNSKAKTVAAYIAACAPKARGELRRVRKAIVSAAPGVRERISYRLPYYSLRRFLCALNAYGPKRDKLSLVITPTTTRAFRRELSGHDVSGGTVHFSADHPLPTGLLRKLLAARVKIAK